MKRKYFYDFDKAGLEAFFAGLGEKPFRAGQLLHRVYHLGATSAGEATEFGAPLREKLAEELDFRLPETAERRESSDGTVKLLLALRDGERVETVLIPDDERLTQCISTQAGCAMGCAFCRTGEGGFTRNLSSGEIIAQVLAAERMAGFAKKPTNVVFMGMGEPLANFDATVAAFDALTAAWGFGLGKRRITVSTCGLVEAIGKLPERMLGSLAVSLNATTDELRDRLMPVNKRWPIEKLIAAIEKIDHANRDKVTIEYVLLGGMNDSQADAKRLVRLLSRSRCKVNLIPYNAQGSRDFKTPSSGAVESFQKYLLDHGFVAVLRKSRGVDILAACGQLKAEHAND